MASQHHGKFTWGVGPNSVHVAGNFNNWSDTATPLHKQDDGSFAADVPLPWGEKQPFKYVVDGEWKVREDEAKEWDAAGNMNNVYTAPHAPEPSASSAAAPAAAAAAVPAASAASTESATTKAVTAAEEPTPAPAIPGASAPDAAPAIPDEPTKPDTLVAAAVPSAGVPSAAGGSEPALGNTHDATKSKATDGPAPALAAPIAVGVPAAPHASEPALGNTHHITAPDADPSSATPGHTAPVVNKPAPEAIEAVAANANIGQEATEEDKTILERAQEYGAGAATTLGSVLGQAAHVVEDATGLHITQGAPMTVEEARAKGIDVDQLEKRELPTDTVSPVGQAPPQDAVAALEEKTQALKVNDGTGVSSINKDQAAVPLPGGAEPKTMKAPDTGLPAPTPKEDHLQHDLPAQNETGENHTHVPMPAITAVSDRDPAKDRSLDAPSAGDTAGTKPISTDPSVDASKAKKDAERNPALTGSTFQEAKSSAKTNFGEGAHRPDAPEANFDAPPPAKKDVAPGEAAPAPVTKDAPSTPAKTAHGNGNGGASAPSTPGSTPAKTSHTRESTSGSDVKKRKSGFFHKFKSAFSPKDKEKK